MKHLKRMLCVVLVLALLLCGVVAVGAAGRTTEDLEKKADALKYLTLFQGTNKGYDLDGNLTREQAITMVVRLMGAEEEALEKNYQHPFKDVPNWALPYVGYAYANWITSGMSVQKFGAGQPVTEAQFLTFMLRVLGYKDGVDFTYSNPYDLAERVGLLAKEDRAEGAFKRGNAVLVSWNALQADSKSGETLAEQLMELKVFSKNQFDAAVKIAAGGEAPAEKPDPTPSPNPTPTPTPTPTPDPEPTPGPGSGDSENNETEDVPLF